jgi:hypothetical protein
MHSFIDPTLTPHTLGCGYNGLPEMPPQQTQDEKWNPPEPNRTQKVRPLVAAPTTPRGKVEPTGPAALNWVWPGHGRKHPSPLKQGNMALSALLEIVKGGPVQGGAGLRRASNRVRVGAAAAAVIERQLNGFMGSWAGVGTRAGRQSAQTHH